MLNPGVAGVAASLDPPPARPPAPATRTYEVPSTPHVAGVANTAGGGLDDLDGGGGGGVVVPNVEDEARYGLHIPTWWRASRVSSRAESVAPPAASPTARRKGRIAVSLPTSTRADPILQSDHPDEPGIPAALPPPSIVLWKRWRRSGRWGCCGLRFPLVRLTYPKTPRAVIKKIELSIRTVVAFKCVIYRFQWT